ncbi:DUF4240 domain-containing protein [Pirellulaceae bacterium SH467]|jgi:hypothetical protein
MNASEFWKIIDTARLSEDKEAKDRESFFLSLRDQLLELPPEEIVGFQTQLMTEFHKTFHWDAVAAAAIVFGDNCDRLDVDGFRFWIVSRGEQEMQAILADMDSIAEMDLVPEEVYLFELSRIAPDVYEELTMEEFPTSNLPVEKEMPEGEEFKRADLPNRLPKLASDFGILPEPSASAVDSQTEEDPFAPISTDVSDEENPYGVTD